METESEEKIEGMISFPLSGLGMKTKQKEKWNEYTLPTTAHKFYCHKSGRKVKDTQAGHDMI